MGHVILRKIWGKAGKQRAASLSQYSLGRGQHQRCARERVPTATRRSPAPCPGPLSPAQFHPPFVSASHMHANENYNQRQTHVSVTTSKTKQVTQTEYFCAATTCGRTGRSATIQKDNLESKAAWTGVLCLPSGPHSPKRTKAYNKA